MIAMAAGDENAEAAPLSYNLSLGGMVLSGNLNQVMLNLNGIMSYGTPKYGNDLIVNGYRIYMQIPEVDEFVRIGDDLLVSDLPNFYLNDKVYLIGLAHYSSSLLHQVDTRLLGGAGVGYAPVRTKQFLMRAAGGFFYEHTSYPSADFNLPVEHKGTVRNVPRAGILSNGWYQKPKSPVTLRYVAWYFIDPTELQDRRYYVDASSNVRIKGPLGFRFGLTYAKSTVVVSGVQTSDLRATFGVNVASKRP